MALRQSVAEIVEERSVERRGQRTYERAQFFWSLSREPLFDEVRPIVTNLEGETIDAALNERFDEARPRCVELGNEVRGLADADNSGAG
ncbi:hypothetical protein TZ00_01760 [Agreia bicolorata]|uniref:Uncharacterized protein n=1 Tax=Agreia bicolorata TaxID=110935 RepID=A0ABR5CJ27_9MICO|nr:hypothetical protein TZ00_01760 [Agreia bicolorata]